MKIDFFSIALGIFLAILHFYVVLWMVKRSLIRLRLLTTRSFFPLFSGFLFRLTILGVVFFLLSKIAGVQIVQVCVAFLIAFTLLLPLEVRTGLLHPYPKKEG